MMYMNTSVESFRSWWDSPRGRRTRTRIDVGLLAGVVVLVAVALLMGWK